MAMKRTEDCLRANTNTHLSGYTAANEFPIKLIKMGKFVLNNHSRIKPIHIQLVPTNKCDCNCSWCSCSEVDRKLELSYQELMDISKWFAGLGAKAVTITGGGEPTLHKDLHTLITNMKVLHNYRVGLVTNGGFVKKDNEQLIHSIEYNVDWVRLSITDRLTDHGIRTFCETFKRPKIGFSHTVSDQSDIETAVGIAKIAEAYDNVTHVRYVTNILDPNPKLLMAVKNSCEGVTDKGIYQDRSDYTKGTPNCLISLLKPVIDASGYVYPCCGVQYAIDTQRQMPESMRMCHWKDFAKTMHFNGSICGKCYYEQYNKALLKIVKTVNDELFI